MNWIMNVTSIAGRLDVQVEAIEEAANLDAAATVRSSPPYAPCLGRHSCRIGDAKWRRLSLAPQEAVGAQAEQLRAQHKAKTGDITITLMWAVNTDLDLHCVAPSFVAPHSNPPAVLLPPLPSPAATSPDRSPRPTPFKLLG